MEPAFWRRRFRRGLRRMYLAEGREPVVKVDGKPVLACQTKVEKDCQVEIPGKKNRGKILSEGFSRKVNFQPELQVKTVWLEKPETGEKKSEWERLGEDVYGISDNKRTSDVDYGCIKTDVKLAGSLYEKRSFNPEWQVAYTDEEILDLRPIVGVHEDSVHGVNSSGEKGDGIFTAAIDLGTTTIVGYLLDGRTGETLAVESRMNPQMQYGGDVIQRANYALEHGTETLSKCVQKTINKILESLIVKTQKAPKIASGRKKVNDQTVNGKTKSAEWMPGVEDIYQVSLVGNTCMHHLFLGIYPASLAHAPYTPAISQSLTLRAADYGIHIHPKGQLLLLPNIAGYIGADTSGCLLALRQDLKDEITLMLDIGTNTEMILGNKYGLAACSAASGPAFEGAKIQCGMRGLPGAIDHVKYEDGKWQYTTIGGEKPVGLCGSGLRKMEFFTVGRKDQTRLCLCHHKKLFLPNVSRICQRMRKVRKRSAYRETKKMGVGSRVLRMIAESILPRKTLARFNLPKQPLPLESSFY